MFPHFDSARCTRCGLCVQDCIYDVLRLGADGAEAVAGAHCVECGHCAAVCPTGAVSLPRVGKSPRVGRRPSPEAFEALIRARRSTRWYKDEPVDRATVDRLLTAAAHAPSGCNARPVAVTVVVDPFVRKQLEEQIQRVARLGAKVIGHPALLSVLKHLPFQEARRLADPDLAFSVELLRSRVTDRRPWVTMGAPVQMLFHADPTRPTPGEDCVIAADHVSLLAETLGLGSCWNGVLTDFVQRLPHLRRRLGLPASDRVYAALSVGWPDLRFAREAPRRALPVHYV